MSFFYDQALLNEWNQRAAHAGLYAVFSMRWDYDECLELDHSQRCWLLEKLPGLVGRTILDIGCGIGRLTKPLSEKAASVTGIDISDVMLEKARLSVTDANVSFVKASASSLPFGDQEFDVVLAVFVLQHILDDALFESALREILRVLKQGGSILIVDGIGSVKDRIPNSPTVIRTLAEYDVLKKRCTLISLQETLCVGDRYTVMLWKDTSV